MLGDVRVKPPNRTIRKLPLSSNCGNSCSRVQPDSTVLHTAGRTRTYKRTDNNRSTGFSPNGRLRSADRVLCQSSTISREKYTGQGIAPFGKGEELVRRCFVLDLIRIFHRTHFAKVRVLILNQIHQLLILCFPCLDCGLVQ